MSSLDNKVGHNSAAFEDAALLADDYIDVGPLSGLPGVDPAQLYAFRHAIKTQGNEDVRQKAVTQMLNRARANAALSPTAYRLLEHIARRCRGPWRYCTEPQDTIGFFCGVKHRQSTQRSLAELDAMDLGFIASVEVPCSRGGRPRRYYTVACTGSDRLGSSDAELAAAASRRKLEVMNDRASARLVEALASKASNCCIEAKQQNVALAETSENKALDEIVGDNPIPTQQNVALSKATSRCNAKQHNVAHSVSSLVQEDITTVVPDREGGVGGDVASSPPARSNDQGDEQLDIEGAIAAAEAAIAKPSRAKRSKRVVRFDELPKGYWNEGDREYARKLGMTDAEIGQQWLEFKSYQISKDNRWSPGPQGWRGAWQRWCRTSVNEYRTAGPKAVKRGPDEDQLRAVRALTAGLDTP